MKSFLQFIQENYTIQTEARNPEQFKKDLAYLKQERPNVLPALKGRLTGKIILGKPDDIHWDIGIRNGIKLYDMDDYDRNKPIITGFWHKKDKKFIETEVSTVDLYSPLQRMRRFGVESLDPNERAIKIVKTPKRRKLRNENVNDPFERGYQTFDEKLHKNTSVEILKKLGQGVAQVWQKTTGNPNPDAATRFSIDNKNRLWATNGFYTHGDIDRSSVGVKYAGYVKPTKTGLIYDIYKGASAWGGRRMEQKPKDKNLNKWLDRFHQAGIERGDIEAF